VSNIVEKELAMNKIILSIFIVSALLSSSVKADEVLTWEDCAQEALQKHPELIVATEKVAEAKANKNISKSSMLPQIDAGLSGKRTQTSSKNTAGEYVEKYNNTFAYSISAQQLVFDGFKTSSDVSSALKTLQAEGYNYLLTSSDIRLSLRSAFVELLRAQELVPLTEDIEKRRKQNYELVKLRYEAGREHKGSLLTAKADLANAEFEVDQAIRNITLAQRELSKELGFAELRSVSVKDEFELSDDYRDNPSLEELADTTPFLRQLIAKKEVARFDLNSKKADFLPKVYLNVSAGRTNDDWPPKHDEWSAGFSVSLPLFEGGSRVSEVSKAKSQLRQAEATERSGRDSVLVTLEETWKDLQDAIDYVSVQKQFLEAAKERAKITRAQYETGLTSFDDWIVIEDNLVTAEKAYLNAQANMLISESYWIQAIGGTLEYENKK